RVYFQARTRAQKPADFTGAIVDEFQNEVVRLETLTDEREPGITQGRAVVTFTPQAKRKYSRRIDSPIGIDRRILLPAVKDTGVVLHAETGIVAHSIYLRV